jgi:hypothetical protein
MNLKIRPLSGPRSAAPLALALALLVLTAGCNKVSDTGNSHEGANSNNAPASAPPLANTATSANTSPSTSMPADPSPTEVVKGYYETARRKDVAGVKRFLSRLHSKSNHTTRHFLHRSCLAPGRTSQRHAPDARIESLLSIMVVERG